MPTSNTINLSVLRARYSAPPVPEAEAQLVAEALVRANVSGCDSAARCACRTTSGRSTRAPSFPARRSRSNARRPPPPSSAVTGALAR